MARQTEDVSNFRILSHEFKKKKKIIYVQKGKLWFFLWPTGWIQIALYTVTYKC